MPTFIDESGDTGPVNRGGKPYFRLAAVWVPTHQAADEFREKIRQLRCDFGLHSGYEFKFAATHHCLDRRKAFFEKALTQEFRFVASSVDKTADGWNLAESSEQHWACATELAALLRAVYHQAEEQKNAPLREPIVVDDNADGNFLKTIKRQFGGLQSKALPRSSLVGKVSFRNSRADEMLQLVDMICGSVGAMIDESDRTWYDLIASRDLQFVALL